MEFEGSVSNLSGRCPELTFKVRNYTVVTDKSTDYSKKSDCSDVKNGRDVNVAGVTQSNGAVRATKIGVDK